ncbi:FAD-dependent oxidoreductase [Rhizobium sp. LjRoot98]|uniref:NAD(P)/FAD-dependent oxidoreductase n=1 Tax=unclassified Rhizobium TaxID=2613769 RepID=UPI000715D6CE|nr:MULTISPECIES: FAD-dependent oxidoreductase [unclassified Rhizobium]KQV40418.1 ferredoxin reductase [Rhizobium sp. Root1204]KQY02779.1 ferredoxin reductase [Rhizobium sp. Root1334]KRB99385.1 ferredoxin reductase [Rhizobium sp. Root73]
MDAIVIVGAGESGTRAAFALREAGYAGTVTLVGVEPHLPYERPPLSKPENGAVTMKALCSSQALLDAGVTYLHGVGATALDAGRRAVTLSDGRALAYDKLLLATGARPRKLACKGAERALDFRTYDDAKAVLSGVDTSRSVAIIGGGLIGMELAAVLRGKGLAVSVIEAAPKPLGRAVPSHFAARLHSRHSEEGVHFHLGQGVSEIRHNTVLLADGTSVPADVVVAAIGVQPEIALAEAAGLATGNGILTDAFLRTSDPDIFAAGDCVAVEQYGGGHVRFESWRNARAQAETAARNMAGAVEPFAAIPWFWSDQYDLVLQVAGLPQPDHQCVMRALPTGELAFYLDDGRLVAAASLGVGNSLAKDMKLSEMLIAASVRPDPAVLADPGVNLKALLKNAKAA